MSALVMWTIYDHPSDWPNFYVARKWIGEEPMNVVLLDADLDRLRETLARKGLVKLMRNEGDDPVILETWL